MFNPIGNIYFINDGIKFGHFLVPISVDTTSYHILELPTNLAVSIKKDEFIEKLNGKLIEFIEPLPVDILQECRNQYKISSKNNK